MLRCLAAAADQVVGRGPVDQAFLALGVEGQPPVAVQGARGRRFLSQAVDDIVAAQAQVDQAARSRNRGVRS